MRIESRILFKVRYKRSLPQMILASDSASKKYVSFCHSTFLKLVVFKFYFLAVAKIHLKRTKLTYTDY